MLLRANRWVYVLCEPLATSVLELEHQLFNLEQESLLARDSMFLHVLLALLASCVDAVCGHWPLNLSIIGTSFFFGVITYAEVVQQDIFNSVHFLPLFVPVLRHWVIALFILYLSKHSKIRAIILCTVISTIKWIKKCFRMQTVNILQNLFDFLALLLDSPIDILYLLICLLRILILKFDIPLQMVVVVLQ